MPITKLSKGSTMHAAGIYADMTVDGPEIGTLVVIVDRAKNLPNRKTMGKQDPYCNCRLAKEAKKTKTDIRGGQVPKWCAIYSLDSMRC
jgi:Ca2+-dependent lipid-binding protein